ncbi:MAG TPA: beta-propeller fold lactonase family protein [Pyrinomonadaceae bacterium]
MKAKGERRKAEVKGADAPRSKNFYSLPRPILALTLCLLPFAPAACGARPRGPLAYVTNERDGTVSVIDTATDRVVETWEIGGRLRGVRVSADGRTVYVASSTPSGKNYDPRENHVAAIDADTGRVLKTYEVGTDPEQLAVLPDGSRLYASNEDAGTASVVDLKTGATLATLVAGIEPEGVRASPDGRWVYVTSETSNTVTVVDTKTDAVAATFMVDSRPRDAAFSPDGSRAYVTTEIGRTLVVVDASAHRVLRGVRVPDEANGTKPMGVAVSPDGRRVYVATGRGGTVDVFDAATLDLVARVPVGQRPWGLAATPDGRKVYAACGGSDAGAPGANEVTVIDAATNTVAARVKAGDGPWGVAVGK